MKRLFFICVSIILCLTGCNGHEIESADDLGNGIKCIEIIHEDGYFKQIINGDEAVHLYDSLTKSLIETSDRDIALPDKIIHEVIIQFDNGDINEYLFYSNSVNQQYYATLEDEKIFICPVELYDQLWNYAPIKEDKTPAIKVNNHLYLRSSDTTTYYEGKNVAEGYISYDTKPWNYPNENNQSNFGKGFQYKILNALQIYVLIENEWVLFERNIHNEEIEIYVESGIIAEVFDNAEPFTQISFFGEIPTLKAYSKMIENYDIGDIVEVKYCSSDYSDYELLETTVTNQYYNDRWSLREVIEIEPVRIKIVEEGYSEISEEIDFELDDVEKISRFMCALDSIFIYEDYIPISGAGGTRIHVFLYDNKGNKVEVNSYQDEISVNDKMYGYYLFDENEQTLNYLLESIIGEHKDTTPK